MPSAPEYRVTAEEVRFHVLLGELAEPRLTTPPVEELDQGTPSKSALRHKHSDPELQSLSDSGPTVTAREGGDRTALAGTDITPRTPRDMMRDRTAATARRAQ